MTARSIFGGSSNVAFAQGTTEYVMLGGGQLTQQTSEALAARLMRTSGSVDYLTVIVSANNLSGSCTVTLRKSAADTALTLTIAAAQTGVFFVQGSGIAYTSGTDTIDASVACASGSGSITIRVITVNFTPASGLTALYGSDGATTYANASTTRYLGIAGNLNSSLTESQRAVTADSAGTFRNLQVYVVSNTRTTATSVKLRKNSADGNQVISVPGTNTPGLLEDTTHTDTVTAGDTIDISVTTSTGTGTLTLAIVCVEFDATDGTSYCLYWMATNGATASSEYYGFVGGAPGTTLSGYQTPLRQLVTLSKLRIMLTANTAGEARNFRTSIGGVNGNLAAAISSGTTGLLSDTTHSDTLVSANLLTVFLEGSATGTATPSFGQMLVTVGTPTAQSFGSIF
jgi:hypothetical protein